MIRKVLNAEKVAAQFWMWKRSSPKQFWAWGWGGGGHPPQWHSQKCWQACSSLYSVPLPCVGDLVCLTGGAGREGGWRGSAPSVCIDSMTVPLPCTGVSDRRGGGGGPPSSVYYTLTVWQYPYLALVCLTGGAGGYAMFSVSLPCTGVSDRRGGGFLALLEAVRHGLATWRDPHPV